MAASPGRRVRIHYTGRLEDGTVFDSSRDRGVFTVPLGKKFVIDGLEEALAGMEAGESKKVTIPPKKAYGPHREELVTEIARGRFPAALELAPGKHLELRSKEGVVTKVMVLEVSEETVKLDANHPLAGKTLTFDIEVIEILP